MEVQYELKEKNTELQIINGVCSLLDSSVFVVPDVFGLPMSHRKPGRHLFADKLRQGLPASGI